MKSGQLTKQQKVALEGMRVQIATVTAGTTDIGANATDIGANAKDIGEGATDIGNVNDGVVESVEEEGNFQLNKNDADPARDVLGRGKESHPDEWNRVIQELSEAGVEVVERVGVMAYEPGFNKKSGRIIIDPDASITALMHEYQHYKDDRARGFPGWEELLDINIRIEMEKRAYEVEMSFLKKNGLNSLTELLWENYEKEVLKIKGIE